MTVSLPLANPVAIWDEHPSATAAAAPIARLWFFQDTDGSVVATTNRSDLVGRTELILVSAGADIAAQPPDGIATALNAALSPTTNVLAY